MEKKKEKKVVVGIVGAGISGLLACKYMVSKGYHPMVFECRSSLGGVWMKTLETTKLQTNKALYQFSDFPWPSEVTQDFPDAQQVLHYLEAYAAHFDLVRYIRFNSKVASLTYQGEAAGVETNWGGTGQPFNPKAKWILTVTTTATSGHDRFSNTPVEVHQVDFVILCVGKFSNVPNIPKFPPGKGPEAFDSNKVLNSMEYSEMDNADAAELVRGKRVAVVGYQKSAMDIAMECSAANVEETTTLIYRTKHWNVPDYLPWGVPLGYLYLNRFSELLVHKPREGFLLSLLATLLAPLRWAFSKFVETDIKKKLRLAKFDMVPEHSFLKEISSCLTSTVPKGFYDRVDKGSIQLKRATTFSFCKQGILLDDDDDQPLQVDLTILCTGFRGVDKLRHIFSSPTFQQLIAGTDDATVPLYRECIHPQIPQLAVIGFSESISNLFTSEMRCRWLAELMDGKFKLPGIKEMEEDIREWDKYMKRYSGDYYRKSCIGALHIWYNDHLCKDMGWNPKRKKGFLAELFQPYGPLDYAQPHP